MALGSAPAFPPARSDVPLALWPCAQPDPHQPTTAVPGVARVLLPAQLAGRIIAEYTRPGALLVSARLRGSAAPGRPVGPPRGRAHPDPARARQTSTMLDLTLPAQHHPLAQVRRGGLTDPEFSADLGGQADILVTVNLDGHLWGAETRIRVVTRRSIEF